MRSREKSLIISAEGALEACADFRGERGSILRFMSVITPDGVSQKEQLLPKLGAGFAVEKMVSEADTLFAR
jgi:hypothetical protein